MCKKKCNFAAKIEKWHDFFGVLGDNKNSEMG